MSGKLVSWQHVEELYATDSSTVGGLQACSRLTPVHIHPTNMQKMNVSLAAQVIFTQASRKISFKHKFLYTIGLV
jgi:hypothetical protein